MSLQQAEVERVPRTNKQIPQLDAKKTHRIMQKQKEKKHYTMIQKQAEDLENRLLLELETGLVASFVTEVNLWLFNP